MVSKKQWQDLTRFGVPSLGGLLKQELPTNTLLHPAEDEVSKPKGELISGK